MAAQLICNQWVAAVSYTHLDVYKRQVQTHASIRKNFLEETCEALEAIDADDAAMMREELGDVLMLSLIHI